LPFAGAALHLDSSKQELIPVCCRTHGAHHCLARAMEHMESTRGSSFRSPRLAQLFEKCPYTSATLSSVQSSPLCHSGQEQYSIGCQIDRLFPSFHQTDPYLSQKRTHGERGPPTSS
jgi:hypothetical protein